MIPIPVPAPLSFLSLPIPADKPAGGVCSASNLSSCAYASAAAPATTSSPSSSKLTSSSSSKSNSNRSPAEGNDLRSRTIPNACNVVCFTCFGVDDADDAEPNKPSWAPMLVLPGLRGVDLDWRNALREPEACATRAAASAVDSFFASSAGSVRGRFEPLPLTDGLAAVEVRPKKSPIAPDLAPAVVAAGFPFSAGPAGPVGPAGRVRSLNEPHLACLEARADSDVESAVLLSP